MIKGEGKWREREREKIVRKPCRFVVCRSGDDWVSKQRSVPSRTSAFLKQTASSGQRDLGQVEIESTKSGTLVKKRRGGVEVRQHGKRRTAMQAEKRGKTIEMR